MKAGLINMAKKRMDSNWMKTKIRYTVAVCFVAVGLTGMSMFVVLETSQAARQSETDKMIVFESNRDGNWEIYRMNSDGSNQVNLTRNKADDVWPVWSSDGERIAFVSERDGNKNIYIMNWDGTELLQLTDSPADDEDPFWSPDGKKLAFVSTRDGNFEIYVVGIDGKGN
jgi:Tol biopolymer transport system component